MSASGDKRFLGEARLKTEGERAGFDDGELVDDGRRPRGHGRSVREGDAGEAVRWYVVRDRACSYDIDDDEAAVWTLSRTPGETGWETDSGIGGFGLTYPEARELADAANKQGAAQAFAERMRPILDSLGEMSYRDKASEMNARGLRTVTGARWSYSTVHRVLERTK
jgi:hypothetical protein